MWAGPESTRAAIHKALRAGRVTADPEKRAYYDLYGFLDPIEMVIVGAHMRPCARLPLRTCAHACPRARLPHDLDLGRG